VESAKSIVMITGNSQSIEFLETVPSEPHYRKPVVAAFRATQFRISTVQSDDRELSIIVA